ATPEHAATLERARQLNAVLGLLVAPLLFVVLAGAAFWSWLRFGRDPVYLDDPSILMAGPPEALTPAAGVFVLAGKSSRRALTTAMLDLASRGRIAFRQQHGLLGIGRNVGVETRPPAPDPNTLSRQRRNDARPLGPAEELAEARLKSVTHDDGGYIEPDDLLKFGTAVPAFDKALEAEVVRRGWFAKKPSSVVASWAGRGVVIAILGGFAVFAGANIPFNGLLFIGAALLAAGVSTIALAPGIAARTL